MIGKVFENMVPFIAIDGQLTNLQQLAAVSPSSPHAARAIAFIQKWQAGEKEFQLQTSGSTGTPKVIHIKREQMEASARFTIKALGLRPGHTALVCLDTKYIAGQMMLVRALVGQMNIIIKTPDANPLQDLDLQPDFTALVPLQLEEIIRHESSRSILNKLHAVLVGGAPVSKSLQTKIEGIEASIYATYGMTETVSHIALKKLNGPDRSNLYKAFDEVTLGMDERNCLTINSVLTNFKKIVTNDRVRLHDKHTFEWLGRIDNIINTGGVKVQSERVERVIETVFHELGIDQRFFVAGLPDDRLGEKVILAIEGTEPLKEEASIRLQLKHSLDKYELPKQLLYFTEFQETATGKVNRKKTLLSGGGILTG